MQQHENNTEHVPSKGTISIFRSGLQARDFLARSTKQLIAGALVAAILPLSMGTAMAQYQNTPPPPPPPDYNSGQQAPQQGYDVGQQGGAPPPPDYGPDQGQGPDQGGPPPGSYQPASPEQLDQLVAPISLYPDALVAQVLTAATYPQQVAAAEQFVQQNPGVPPEQLGEMANQMPWDPSVKALTAFPQVLADLNRNMSWTTQLGNAYYNQPQDVMGAVQDMRGRAYQAGTLRSGPQLAVDYAPGAIVIAPVNPGVVYVPYYNPWTVYGAPLAVYPGFYWGPPRGVVFGAGLAFGFGVGIAIGAFAHFGWGFHAWAPNWGAHAVFFNHNTYISHSTTVINHGYYGHFDRAPGARAYNARIGGGYGSHTTINNVTVNRGGNTYNRGGNTYNRGGNTFNNNHNSYQNGNNFNRGGNTYNHGGTTYNHGGQVNQGHAQGEQQHGGGGQPHGGGGGGGHEHGGGGDHHH